MQWAFRNQLVSQVNLETLWFRDNGKHNWFSGGAGADTFKVRGDVFGNNRIEDFEDGVDLLQIMNAPDFGALCVDQDGADTLVTWNGHEIRLQDTLSTDITEADFIF